MAKDWIPSWMRQDSTDDDKDKKVEIPKELKDTIEASVKATMSPIEERLKSLDSLTAFAADYKKDKEKADADRVIKEEAERAKQRTTTEPTNDDLAALLLSDPKQAFNTLNKPVTELALTLRADNIRREVFEDRKEEFPYYNDEIKKEIDKTLNEQSLAFRNNAQSVENVYYTVVGRRQKEINEGKIKSRFASSSTSTNATQKDDNASLDFVMNDDMKRAARLSGMTEADYLKLVERAAKAGEIDYV